MVQQQAAQLHLLLLWILLEAFVYVPSFTEGLGSVNFLYLKNHSSDTKKPLQLQPGGSKDSSDPITFNPGFERLLILMICDIIIVMVEC